MYVHLFFRKTNHKKTLNNKLLSVFNTFIQKGLFFFVIFIIEG